MSIRYLLPCLCGKKIPVDRAQAGQTIQCECGADVEVPTLLGLRSLEMIEEESPTTTRSGWGVPQGLTIVGGVITLGAVAACSYIAATSIGEALLIGDFKINLAMIAAFLTLIGYSLNDTIVVFDRIRENRGKARLLNPQIITNSINQTISRTILTSFTTFVVVLIMYIFGGAGLRGFTFAIGFGIIIGTYSSIAIAAPILLLGAKMRKQKNK